MKVTLRKVRKTLRTKEEFSEIEEWTVESLTPGKVSKQAYRFSSHGESYFVKETKNNERRILQLLTSLKLQICPLVVYRDLLEQNLLVAEYIPGGHIKSKKLDPGLVENFAVMHNVLNSESLLRQHSAFSGCKFNDKDDGFYRGSITGGLDEGYENILRLRGYDLPIVEEYLFTGISPDCNRSQLPPSIANNCY